MPKISINEQIDHIKEMTIYHKRMFSELLSRDEITEEYISLARAKEKSILDTLIFCEDHIDDIREFIISKNDKKPEAEGHSASIKNGVKHCCTLLSDKEFQQFLYRNYEKKLALRTNTLVPTIENPDYYPQLIRLILKIKSRSEISKDEQVFKRWRTLFEAFVTEQRFKDYDK